jgi:hypothetical protein
VLGVLSCPWLLMANATAFFGFIFNYSALFGPLLGVMLADYFIVRKRTLAVASSTTRHPAGVIGTRLVSTSRDSSRCWCPRHHDDLVPASLVAARRAGGLRAVPAAVPAVLRQARAARRAAVAGSRSFRALARERQLVALRSRAVAARLMRPRGVITTPKSRFRRLARQVAIEHIRQHELGSRSSALP